MEQNKVYNMDFLNNSLPDKYANLIIADPPYFEVKGDFDFVWGSFDDYLKDVEKWAVECKRILSDNGTLFWYGNSKKIAYSQLILDKYFNLENSLVWRKKDSIQYQYYSPDLARTFNTHNERLLMYSHDDFNVLHCYEDSRNYMFGEMKKAGHNYSTIDKILFGAGLQTEKSAHSHLFINPNSNQGHFVTKEQYTALQNNGMCLSRTYEDLQAVYDTVRREYEETRRFFYNPNKYEEVLEFSQEGHKTGQYNHDTIKPETLTRALILTCSRPNDLVVVPFSGSGTECAMAVKEGRRAIGFDIDSKNVEMSNKRMRIIMMQPELFNVEKVA